MNKCLTIPLTLLHVSGCLVEKPECGYAYKFGFSFICTHPDHVKFHVHTSDSLTKQDALDQYETLRRKRHDEFIASLDESSKNLFLYETDFFGRPVTKTDMNEQH